MNVYCGGQDMDYRQNTRKWMRNYMAILIQGSTTRWFLALTAILIVSLTCPKIAQSDTKVPHEINVTRDSEPGWYPSPELEQRAKSTTEKYLVKFDKGKFADAYAMMAEAFKGNSSEAQFIQFGERILNSTGAILTRKFLKTTWTKNPANGPFKGTFAAIDIASEYTKTKRSCGYIVLYLPPDSKDFQVMRLENNFLTDATAVAIAKQKSQKALDDQWLKMSANCPNYAGD
jgi:Protein of unknown function (DUF4019)